jgi:hypothetical protein
VLDPLGARNGDDVVPLREDPGQSDLTRGGALLVGERADRRVTPRSRARWMVAVASD